MKMLFKYWVLPFAFLLFSSFSQVPEKQKCKLLVLHSYHQGLEWTDNISKGIKSVFSPLERDVEVYFEYLDTKRTPGIAYEERFDALFKTKLKDIHFDAMIVTDNNALRFVVLHREKYFDDYPIVFCGINNFSESMIQGVTGITGVVENPDMAGTIRLMQKLHPTKRKVLVINDKTTTGLANRREIMQVIPQFEKDLEFEYYEDFSIEEVAEKVKGLSGEWMIYLLSLNRDRNEKYLSYADAIALVSENSRVPVYGSWGFYLGKGIVGGVITSGFEQGAEAARMARRILMGDQVNSIPILWNGPKRAMIDYAVAQRFGLALTDVPADVQVINRPVSFLQRNYMELFLIFCFSLLVILFLLLLMQIKRKERIKLEALNRDLDRQVEVRTRQLKEANQTLTVKNEEISKNAQQLARQEELTRLAYLRLKVILNNSLVGILAVDTNRNIIDTNFRFCEILGFELDDLLGKNVSLFYPNYADYEEFGKVYVEKLTKEKVVRVEHQLKRKDESLVWCLMYGSALDYSELEHGFIWVVDDISDRKEAQSRLEKSEKALRLANSTKDKFFSIIAHDLKNPISALVGFSKMLKEDYQAFDEDTRKEFIGDIFTASQNMRELLEDLLTWGRIQIGGLEWNPERLDYAEMASSAVSGVSKMAKTKNISVTSNVQGPIWIHADSYMINTVLRNLLGNAIKFTHPGGKIDLTARVENDLFEASICDNGVGISPDEVPYLFEIGKKVQHPGTEEEPGTGLGLNLCKEFVEKNGGKIWVESELGKGSCFRFSLPLTN